MAPRIPRRAFLVGLGGVASVSLAFGLWRYHPWAAVREPYPLITQNRYVDWGEWILTPADKARLTATANIRLIEDTVLAGEEMAERPTENVDACSSWCVQLPDCLGFSYAKADHPDPSLRNNCSLKGASALTQSADAHFTSGVR